MKLQGTAHVYGDHVDTDVIIPARYLNTSDPKELASHCMEDIDAAFVSRVQPGDVLVGGVNFGCGSSREHAPLAIKHAGISCVVARSFARIFYRNALNTGLPIVVSDLPIQNGDTVHVDLDQGVIRNVSTGQEQPVSAFPPFLQSIINAGGLMPAMQEAAK
mgnify:CR=1 FL=1